MGNQLRFNLYLNTVLHRTNVNWMKKSKVLSVRSVKYVLKLEKHQMLIRTTPVNLLDEVEVFKSKVDNLRRLEIDLEKVEVFYYGSEYKHLKNVFRLGLKVARDAVMEDIKTSLERIQKCISLTQKPVDTMAPSS